MEQINPYAIVRNTATYEAYKAYMRKAMKSGYSLFILGISLSALWLPIEMIVAKRLGYPKTGDLPLLLAFTLGPVALSGLLVLIGGLKMVRFRREHPIPEEWRQIPRIRTPPVPGRKPPLP